MGNVRHLLAESCTDSKRRVGASHTKPIVVTSCGEVGRPYVDNDATQLRTTIWGSDVTCPKCREKSGGKDAMEVAYV